MLADVTRSGVLTAIAEYDELGQDAFLEHYGLGRAREYFLVHDGRRYDSKAVVGAAHGYDLPDEGPLSSDAFSGGRETVRVVLTRLGFEVEGPNSGDSPETTQFWWVNQGQTYAAESTGGYIWAPQQARNNVPLKHHTAVASVAAGDRLIHYAGGKIQAIGLATSNGHDSNRPSELPGEAWNAAGFRADVEYITLDAPIRLAELDAGVRSGSGGPFNSLGGVNQGYLYPLPERVRSHLMSQFKDRLPVGLGEDGSTARLVAVYVGRTSEPNFNHSVRDGRWGWRQSRDDYDQVSPGDTIAFAFGYSGGSPRVQADEFVHHRLGRVVLGTISSKVHHDSRPYWPDERGDTSYPFRLSFDFLEEREDVAIADLDAEFGGPVAEGFRNSAIAQGRGVIVNIDRPTEPGSEAQAPFEPVSFDLITRTFADAVAQTGLHYSDELTRLFLTSLATKRFLILTGLSGSGKTRLAQSFGEWLGPEQCLIVAVRPDWTSPDALLGYENGLSEADANGHAWNVPRALEFLLKASGDLDRPYLLVLDEMNLAHVERYFADVLSGMESNHPVLPNLSHTGDRGWRIADSTKRLLPLPTNVFVVGTVNIDETTCMFSPKVLDRANTIEFRVDTGDLLVNTQPIANVAPGEGRVHRSLLELARTHRGDGVNADVMSEWLRELHELLAGHDREFGHRVFHEILRFADLYEAAGVTDPLSALDAQVLQKVLPKFHGSIREINDPLSALGGWAFHGPGEAVPADFDPVNPPLGEAALPRSFDKIRRMTRRLRANHFVSFAE